MAALAYDRYGSADDVLAVRSMRRPRVAADEVLVRVRAAGVSPGDWFTLHGEPYVLRLATGIRRPRRHVLGLAVAGTVEQVGHEVDALSEGDAVCGEVDHGGFATWVPVRPAAAARMPEGMSFEQAAAVPVTGVTALHALRDVAQVEPGQHVLVTGASGGVGTFAVQIAKVLGAVVTGVCGPDSTSMVAALGADHVIDYTSESLADRGQSYDVILDNVGTWPLSELRRALTPTGMLMPNSNTHGGRWVGGYLRRAAQALVVSPFTRQRLRPFSAAADGDALADVLDLVRQGSVTPVVSRTYPLDDAPAALAHYGGGHAHGRVVVTMPEAQTGRP